MLADLVFVFYLNQNVCKFFPFFIQEAISDCRLENREI